MNERIKQLAAEAKIMTEDSINMKISFSTQLKAFSETFSKLIVKECIQNIRDNMEIAKVDTLGDKDLFLETLRTSGHFYITELEQHFGVQEQTESQKMAAAGYTRRPRGWTKEDTE